MRSHKSLTINFIMNIILTMSSFIFPLITFPYVSRILLPEGMGKVSFATSIISYFSMIAQLGIPTYGIRACARVRDNEEELSRTVHELFLINLIMSAAAHMMLFVCIIHIPKFCQEKPLFMIISLTIAFNAIGMEWLYKALEQYTYITVRSIVFKAIALIAMFLFIHEEKDYVCYGGITILAASASNILNFINIRKYITLRSLGNYNLKRHMKAVIIFFAMSCAATIYTNLDTVMLGFMKSDGDVGYYNAAVKVKTILLGIVTSLGTVLLPRVSYYVENGFWDEFYRIAAKAIKFVLLIAVPICVYFILFAEETIRFLSGELYFYSIFPMQIIMPTLIFIGLTNIMGIQILVPTGKEKYVLYSEIIGAVVDLFMNAALIPEYAAVGAAIGTLAAEAAVWAAQLYFLRISVKKIYREVQYFFIMGAAAFAMAVSVWVKWMNWNAFITLAVSASFYVGGYLLFLYLVKEPLILEIGNKVKRMLK